MQLSPAILILGFGIYLQAGCSENKMNLNYLTKAHISKPNKTEKLVEFVLPEGVVVPELIVSLVILAPAPHS